MTHTNGVDRAGIPGLAGKRVLVTGGSAGIGRATVLAFAASGATVCAAARRPERLDAVVAAAPKGSTIHRVVLDLTSEDSCRAAVKEAVSLMGGLDVVVNCGGATTGGSHSTVFEQWAAMGSLHVSSVAVLAEEALPELKKSGKGAIVNVSSGLSVVAAGSPAMTSYKHVLPLAASTQKDPALHLAHHIPMLLLNHSHAMKAAQDMVTKSLALQLAKDGIRVNGVQPGVIRTEAIASMAAHNGISVDEQVRRMDPLHPVGRVGQPQEVANVIAFLSSDLASFMTGAIVPVDGGYVLTSWSNKDQ